MIDYDKDIEQIIPAYRSQLADLIAIPSYRNLAAASKEAPFGQAIQAAFAYVKQLALDMGLIVHEEAGYAMDIRTGDGDDYIGVLCHIDVVDAIEREKWDSDPYTLTERNGVLYGRGVNDNKGPLLAMLHVIRILSKQPLKKPIRLIIGGAEETTWECMNYYFKHQPQPAWAFSPDGDFPIVNGEKGILQVRIRFNETKADANTNIIALHNEYQAGFIASKAALFLSSGAVVKLLGKHAVSRHPERGESAAVSLLNEVEARDLLHNQPAAGAFNRLILFLKEVLVQPGKDDFKLGEIDPEMGASSVAMTHFSYEKGQAEIELDLRYTRTHTEASLLKLVQTTVASYGGEVINKTGRQLLFVPKDTELIQTLQAAYQAVTGEKAEPITKGGASYARVLERGVAFGPTFPGEVPNSHLENERMALSSIKKAMKIYLVALEKLAGANGTSHL